MKNVLYVVAFICVFGFLAFTPSSNNNYKVDGPVIAFDKMVHNFGVLKEDQIVRYTFTYKNTGNAPLVITDIEKPCGCTVPEWSRQPLMPGETGEVKVAFSAKGQPKGVFRKTMNVTSNAQTGRTPILMISGEIVKGKVTSASGR